MRKNLKNVVVYQVTDDYMVHAQRLLDTKGYKYTPRVRNTYFHSTTKS
jgi:hypothetical protein